MMWPLLAVGAAFFDAAKAAWIKRLVKNTDQVFLAWASRAGALLLLSPLFFYTSIPLDNPDFIQAVTISGIINSVTSILFVLAIERTDLSVAMPLKSFAPLFLLLTAPIILGEFPEGMGLIGVLLIVSGSYFLEARKGNKGVFAPLKSLFAQSGPRLMLLITFLWSIASNFNKIGVLEASPVAFLLAMHVFMTLTLLPFMLRRVGNPLPMISGRWKELLVLGVFSAAIPICQWSALELTLVVYVLALKRVSALFGVAFGAYFYGERLIPQRFVAAIIMLSGVLCITLWT